MTALPAAAPPPSVSAQTSIPFSHRRWEAFTGMVIEAGWKALAMQENLETIIKPDGSPVTTGDLEVTRFLKAQLADYFSQSGEDYILIDEESLESLLTPQQVAAQAKGKWLVSLDPIDGTKGYMYGTPLWSVSLGVLDGTTGKPLFGVVWAPGLNTLWYGDEQAAFKVNAPYSGAEVRTPIKPHDKSWEQLPVVVIDGQHWEVKAPLITPFNPHAASLRCAWVAEGSAIMTAIRDRLWDLAGIWPIMQHAGLGIFSLKDGTPMTRFTPEQWDENWKITPNSFLTCPPDQFEAVRKLIVQRG